ncbi:MAG TPA: hypothetical protein VGR51_08460 [Thermoplasmata archaeon]|nr:hypothetical protein [Thermoplasmata archaeon]
MRLDPLHVLPFASAAAWVLAAFAPFPRGRPRTPTEGALALFAVLLGLWALVDGVVLQTTDPAWALTLVRMRDATASFAGLSLLCFAKWSTRGRSPTDIGFAIPVVAAVALGWLGAKGIAMEPWGPRALRDLPLYAAWFAQSFLYVIASFAFLALGLRALWRQDRPLALRGVTVIAGTGLATVLALSTNIAISLAGSTAPPPFSSLLVIPGLLMLALSLVAPVPRGRVVHALRRMLRSFGREVLGASLLGEDGTVFGIAMQPPVDRQQFGLPEVMVAVQQFLMASPRGPPGALAVPVGDVTFLVRRRATMTLVVAVRGREHDFLDSAVEEAFNRLEEVSDLLSSAREGSIPSMATIQSILRELVAGGARTPGA